MQGQAGLLKLEKSIRELNKLNPDPCSIGYRKLMNSKRLKAATEG
jgi:hypothetical protein